MARKYFGRLTGTTNAVAALTEVSPANAATPYTAQQPGAKLLAQGEGANSATFNRALGALQTNIESIFDVLDAPALMDSVISARTSSVGGSAGLVGVAVEAPSVDLAVLTDGEAPVHWVYVGLHKSRVGDYLKAYRQSSNNGPDDYLAADPLAAVEWSVAQATDVKEVAAAASYFPVQTYTTSSPHALPNKIPPVTKVRTALPPYNSGTHQTAIGSWTNDGCFLSSKNWHDIYARPGCFVEVTGSTYNDGLYRIAAINSHDTPTLSKAVLTRGGFVKITVEDATQFSAGERVSWRSAPNHVAGSVAAERLNFAYIAYAIGNTLYLDSFAAEQDLPVITKTHGLKTDSASGTYGGSRGANSYGLEDQEAGVTDNWGLLVGSRIYDADNNDNVTAVTSLLPASHPVQFRTTGTAGNLYLCAPSGFLLNPVVFLDVPVVGGNYFLSCKTLSTNREKFCTTGSTAQRLTAFDNGAPNKFDFGHARAFARFIKTGDESESVRWLANNAAVSTTTPFSGSAVLLGDNLWKIVVTPTVGQLTLEAALAAENVQPGASMSFQYTNDDITAAKLVRATGNTCVVRDVDASAWWTSAGILAGYTQPIAVGSSYSVGLSVFSVATVLYAPTLRDASGNKIVPGQGLNAAYNAHYTAARSGRGAGRGAIIRLADSQPVSLYQSATYNAAVPLFHGHAPAGVTTQKVLGWYNAAQPASFVEVAITSGSLTFKDTKTANSIPLSDASNTALTGGALSILGALSALNAARVFEYYNTGGANIVRPVANNYTNSTTFVFPTQSITGASTRVQFNAGAVGAFRAGTVSGPNWDAANLGVNSAAFGNNSKASGASSFAAGETAFATGEKAAAFGASNSEGVESFSAGNSSATARGAQSVAIGFAAQTGISAEAAIALGKNVAATGVASAAIGEGAVASAARAIAIGGSAQATYADSIALGSGATASRDFTLAIGNAVASSGGATARGGTSGAGTTTAKASASGAVAFAVNKDSIIVDTTASEAGAYSHGTGSQATGAYSRATGYLAKSLNRGEVSHASFQDAVNRHQIGDLVMQLESTDDSQKRLKFDAVDGASSGDYFMSLFASRSYVLNVMCICRQNGSTNTKAWSFTFTAETSANPATVAGITAGVNITAGGSVVVINSGFVSEPHLQVTVGNNQLFFNGQGLAATNLRWTLSIRYAMAGA